MKQGLLQPQSNQEEHRPGQMVVWTGPLDFQSPELERVFRTHHAKALGISDYWSAVASLVQVCIRQDEGGFELWHATPLNNYLFHHCAVIIITISNKRKSLVQVDDFKELQVWFRLIIISRNYPMPRCRLNAFYSGAPCNGLFS